MKLLIQKIVLFSLFVFLTIAALTVVTNRIINRGNYFQAPANTEYLILGHSQPACAFEDTLIDHFWNMAEPTEGYFYTFYKANKLLEQNKQIKAVFLEFTNNQLISFGNERIWGQYIFNNLPKFSSVMSRQSMYFLFKKNPFDVIRSLPISLKNNLLFLIGGKKNYPHEIWNTRVVLHEIYTGPTTEPQKELASKTGNLKGNYSVSDANLIYLAKIIRLCKDKHVDVYLIRSPLPSFSAREVEQEGMFNDLLKKEFSDVPFLDFKDFPLLPREIGDTKHLNDDGARKFSSFFNELIHDGLLNAENKQEMINKKIQTGKKPT